MGKSMDVCVASSGVGIIAPAPLLLSRRERLRGTGMEVPPPKASTDEINDRKVKNV